MVSWAELARRLSHACWEVNGSGSMPDWLKQLVTDVFICGEEAAKEEWYEQG